MGLLGNVQMTESSQLPRCHWGVLLIAALAGSPQSLSIIATPQESLSIADFLEEQTHSAMTNSSEPIWRLGQNPNRCGVNVLYMFLTAAGQKATYDSILAGVPDDERGVSLFDLSILSNRLGVGVHILRLNRQSLLTKETPLIAHFEKIAGVSGHYVLITGMDDKTVSYVDGTTARGVSVSWPDFERRWSGYVMVRSAVSIALIDAVLCGSLTITAVIIYLILTARLRICIPKNRLFRNMESPRTESDINV